MNAFKKLIKERNWKVGTILCGQGPEWGAPGEIRITAIGESAALARRPGCIEFSADERFLANFNEVERRAKP